MRDLIAAPPILATLEHFTVIIQSQLVRDTQMNKGDLGLAVVSVRCWAEGREEAEDLAVYTMQELAGGFVKGKVELNRSEPTQPAKLEPYGYGVEITRYDATAE